MATAREQFHAQPGVSLIETRSSVHEDTIADLVACSKPGKRPCFLLLWWEDGRLLQAEIIFTEAEGRACLAHGRLYDLTEFAIPAEAVRLM